MPDLGPVEECQALVVMVVEEYAILGRLKRAAGDGQFIIVAVAYTGVSLNPVPDAEDELAMGRCGNTCNCWCFHGWNGLSDGAWRSSKGVPDTGPVKELQAQSVMIIEENAVLSRLDNSPLYELFVVVASPRIGVQHHPIRIALFILSDVIWMIVEVRTARISPVRITRSILAPDICGSVGPGWRT